MNKGEQKTRPTTRPGLDCIGGSTQNRTEGRGFAVPCLTTWPCCPNKKAEQVGRKDNGAGYGVRTRDLNLGKVARYQLRQARIALNTIQIESSVGKKNLIKCRIYEMTGKMGCLSSGYCQAGLLFRQGKLLLIRSPFTPLIGMKKPGRRLDLVWIALEAALRIELRVGDLQSHALPLGHAALIKKPNKSAVKTMERATGFEPATSTLARLRATNCAKPALQEVIYGI